MLASSAARFHVWVPCLPTFTYSATNLSMAKMLAPSNTYLNYSMVLQLEILSNV